MHDCHHDSCMNTFHDAKSVISHFMRTRLNTYTGNSWDRRLYKRIIQTAKYQFHLYIQRYLAKWLVRCAYLLFPIVVRQLVCMTVVVYKVTFIMVLLGNYNLIILNNIVVY